MRGIVQSHDYAEHENLSVPATAYSHPSNQTYDPG